LTKNVLLTIARDAGARPESRLSARGLARQLIRGGWRSRGRVLAAYGGQPRFPSPGSPGSLWWPLRAGSVDHVRIDASLRLFPGAWADALRAYAEQLLAPGGTLAADSAPGATGGGGRNSVLAWFLDGAPEILRLACESAGDELGAAAFERLARRPGPDTPPGVSGDPIDRATAVLGEHGYLVGGLAYKAPLVGGLLKTLRPNRGPGRHLDIGGAYGLLAAELRADPELAIAESVTLDANPAFGPLAARLAESRNWAPGAPPAFTCAAVEDVGSFPVADLVTAIGSLLYVPRSHLPTTLDRLWEAVEPGGLLVVHENIKAPSYSRDYDVMFEPEELDGFLGRYGTIRYFSSTRAIELRPETVRRATVFRAVVKASA
jgi:hypothetical protein